MDSGNHSALPERIGRLRDLAFDLSWSWNPDAREVFRLLDYPLWRLTAHNPVQMLVTLPQERIALAAADPVFLSHYDAAIERLDRSRAATGAWYPQRYPEHAGSVIAYFSAEFALHQSLPIYAGGLGALAGDHCKEASDLGLPLLAVGFVYPMGYFRQKISADGWQIERHERLRYDQVAVERAVTPDGRPCLVEVPVGYGTVRVAVWTVRLGCVKLLLLDTDVPENAARDRELSSSLYVSEREVRLQQEI